MLATWEERRSIGLLRRRIQPGSAVWWFRRDRLAVASLVVVVCIILAAVAAPLLTPYASQGRGAPDLSQLFRPPSGAHPLGTDDFGRDELARVLFAARTSLIIGFVVVGAGALIGTLLGAVAGYFGGWLQEVIMRFTDMVLSFPALLLAIVLSVVLGAGLWSAVIAIAATWWPWYTRIVRPLTASIRERNYVRAARAMGATRRAILFRHVLPNVIGPVRVQATLDLGAAILTGASLSFLGLGAQPPAADWGSMIASGGNYLLAGYWWLVVFPGLAICVTVLAFNLLGDGFQAAFDPRLR